MFVNWYEADTKGCFFFQAEDGIRDLVRSRGLGDVYKRQAGEVVCPDGPDRRRLSVLAAVDARRAQERDDAPGCLLYTSDAADE